MAVSFLRVKHNFRLIYPLWNMLQSFRLNSESKDSMETFISDLKQRRMNKWNQIQKETISRNQSRDEITSGEQNDLIEEIFHCLDTHDEDRLGNVIERWLRRPEILKGSQLEVLCESLEFATRVGNVGIFRLLLMHLKAHEAEFHKDNVGYFEVLGLELEWRSGQNIDELLEKFALIYKQNISNELMMRQIMKLYSVIIQDTVERKGESAVIKLKHKIEGICVEAKSHQLLFNLWRKLFESFWYSDQQIASELIAKHAALRRILSKQLSFLCFIYLRNNNTELVNRLIQIFLQFNSMKQVETLIKILFEFECWRRNMDAVLQIVQLCLKLDIQLSDKENKKFLDLLLKRPRDAKPRPDKKIIIEKYQFKF